ncbi:MAG: hypothetical protein HYS05_11300 [Acidobacteria bacterium]|nr:hypothetical protein [Acidobacteriota bacterium]
MKPPPGQRAGLHGAAGSFRLAALFAIEREASVVKTVRAYLAVQRASESTRRRLARRQGEIADVLDQAREWLELCTCTITRCPLRNV